MSGAMERTTESSGPSSVRGECCWVNTETTVGCASKHALFPVGIDINTELDINRYGYQYTVHVYNNNTSPHAAEFPFATCFICQERGHLSRACPDNLAASNAMVRGEGRAGEGDV